MLRTGSHVRSRPSSSTPRPRRGQAPRPACADAVSVRRPSRRRRPADDGRGDAKHGPECAAGSALGLQHRRRERQDSRGEGFAGLTRAFMYAGARGLLVSHWAVNSRSTQALIAATFRRSRRADANPDAIGGPRAAGNPGERVRARRTQDRAGRIRTSGAVRVRRRLSRLRQVRTAAIRSIRRHCDRLRERRDRSNTRHCSPSTRAAGLPVPGRGRRLRARIIGCGPIRRLGTVGTAGGKGADMPDQMQTVAQR